MKKEAQEDKWNKTNKRTKGRDKQKDAMDWNNLRSFLMAEL